MKLRREDTADPQMGGGVGCGRMEGQRTEGPTVAPPSHDSGQVI